MATSLQDAIICNTVAVNNKFATVEVATAALTQLDFIAALNAALLAAGYDQNCKGFIIDNSSGGYIKLYTGTGRQLTGLHYVLDAMLPYFPIAESPSTILYIYPEKTSTIRVACFFA